MASFANPTREQVKKAIEALGASLPSSFSKVEALDFLVTCADAQLLLAKDEEVRLISAQIQNTGNKRLMLLAEAMCHTVLKKKPDTVLLGNELASLYSEVDRIPQNEGEKKLLKKVLGYLDIEGYVFSTTPYDECDNGRFWRRS